MDGRVMFADVNECLSRLRIAKPDDSNVWVRPTRGRNEHFAVRGPAQAFSVRVVIFDDEPKSWFGCTFLREQVRGQDST
jgi:hypothetical protein